MLILTFTQADVLPCEVFRPPPFNCYNWRNRQDFNVHVEIPP
jgi:hypothetical protein